MNCKTIPAFAAALIGLGALVHVTPAVASPPCETCDYWYQECQADPNSTACDRASMCHFCPPPVGATGAPPAKHVEHKLSALARKESMTVVSPAP